MRRVLILLLFLCVAPQAHAQDEGSDDNGFIINLLEDSLSTETRKIRLSGVEGVLSSSATVARITISDQEGIWLQIENARIVWNRTALLRGRVEVEELAASKISIPRGPMPDPNALPTAEAQPLTVPELPVSVELGGLKIDSLVFGEELFGLAAEMEVTGALSIVDGEFETELAMERLDGPGGSFALTAGFSAASEELAVDLQFSEPPDGIVANALNLPDKPAVDLTVAGRGPLADLDMQLDLDVDGRPLVEGGLRLSENAGLRAFDANLIGKLQDVVPEAYAPFFAGDAALRLVGETLEGGGVRIGNLSVETGGLQLDGNIETEPSGFLRSAKLEGSIGAATGPRLILPFGNGAVSVQEGLLDFAFGQGTGEEWGGAFVLQALRSGDIAAETVVLTLDGVAENLANPAERALSGRFATAIQGITSDRPEVEEALGARMDAAAGFSWAVDQPFVLSDMVVAGAGISLEAEGEIEDLALDGKVIARISDLSPFADLAGRELAGALTFSSEGRVQPLEGAFDIRLLGTAENLVLDDERMDALLAGTTELSGGLARTSRGIIADAFRVQNEQITLTAQGRYATTDTDFSFVAALSDIALVEKSGSGAASIVAQAIGPADRIAVQAELKLPAGTFVDRSVRDLLIGFRGQIQDGGREVDGALRGAGQIGDAALKLQGILEVDERLKAFKAFKLALGETDIAGTIGLGGDGLVSGSATVLSPDLSVPAALLLTDAEGSVDVRAVLSRSGGGQRVQMAGSVGALEVAGQSIGALDLDLDVLDALGIPLIQGVLTAEAATLGGIGIEDLSASAERNGAAMDVKVGALLERGTRVALAGGLSNLSPGYQLDLSDLVLEDGDHRAALTAPATLVAQGSAISLSPLDLSVDGGRIRAEGRLDGVWDVALELADVPLSISDLVVPDLGLRGLISGSALVQGEEASPDISFDLGARDLSAAAIDAQNLPAMDINATGRTNTQRLRLEADVQAGSLVDVRLAGGVPLASDAGQLDLALDVRSLDLAGLNAVANVPGLAGRLEGKADVSGTLKSPVVAFSVAGDGITARAAAENGVRPASLRADGRYERDVLVLNRAEVSGGEGLQITASGQVPVARKRLNIAFDGRIPLSLANIAMAEQATQLDGVLTTEGRVQGPWTSPGFSGTARVGGATLVDPLRNLRVDGIALDATYSGNGLRIRSLTGNLSQGGTISVDGRLNFGRGFPADLRLNVDGARYADGELVDTRLSANLALNGPVLGAGTLGGRIDIGKSEITVPNSFGIREGVLLDIEHRGLPPDAALTLKRAGLPEEEDTEGGGSSSQLRLDLEISAPSQIFVRGRGLDAEMGGVVQLRGPVSDIRPTGQFDLIRGRINILGQRIDFDEGIISLSGDFDPVIRLSASTVAQDTTVVLSVEGRVSDPEITLTSSPELPQDELLALLIFQRNLSELTPFQVAQLATAAATLAGGGSGGLLEGLRASTGLSNLDLTTGDDGEIGVRAGAYLQDNVYLDVEAEDDGDARATINIDITDSLRGRATFGNDGDSSIGIFFEKDY